MAKKERTLISEQERIYNNCFYLCEIEERDLPQEENKTEENEIELNKKEKTKIKVKTKIKIAIHSIQGPNMYLGKYGSWVRIEGAQVFDTNADAITYARKFKLC